MCIMSGSTRGSAHLSPELLEASNSLRLPVVAVEAALPLASLPLPLVSAVEGMVQVPVVKVMLMPGPARRVRKLC